MLSKTFLTYTLERALKTFAQALVATFGAANIGILQVDWTACLSVAAMAALVSALTSVVAYTGPGTLSTPEVTGTTSPSDK